MILNQDPGLPHERFWTPGKLISATVAAGYVCVALVWFGPADAFEVALGCVVSILMIWLPEVMGDYTGWGTLHGRPIMRPTPSGCVWIAGWLMLLLPMALIAITALQVGS